MTVDVPAPRVPRGIHTISWNGWANNLLLSNGTAELIITLDVGPRVLSYTKLGGSNPLKVFDEQLGGTGETSWKIRGGHRLWIAPEHRRDTYAPDNAPVAWEKLGPLRVLFTPPPEILTGFQKQIEIAMDPVGTGVTLTHRVTRIATTPATMGIWALTVMRSGGIALVPQPPLGEHPRDLLPNRKLVLWPYTDLSDSRWKFGPRFLRLRQEPKRSPTKIGLSNALGWSAYLVGGLCFLKHFGWNPDAAYPDDGSNCEIYASPRMLEVESLGPLQVLAPGQSSEHIERWELHDATADHEVASDHTLAEFLQPLLARGPQTQ